MCWAALGYFAGFERQTTDQAPGTFEITQIIVPTSHCIFASESKSEWFASSSVGTSVCVPSLQPLTLSVRRRSLRRKAVDKAGFAADDNAAAAAVVVVNKAGMIFADDAAEFDIAESAADRCLFKLNGNREIVFRKQLDVGWQVRERFSRTNAFHRAAYRLYQSDQRK